MFTQEESAKLRRIDCRLIGSAGMAHSYDKERILVCEWCGKRGHLRGHRKMCKRCGECGHKTRYCPVTPRPMWNSPAGPVLPLARCQGSATDPAPGAHSQLEVCERCGKRWHLGEACTMCKRCGEYGHTIHDCPVTPRPMCVSVAGPVMSVDPSPRSVSDLD